MITVAHLDEQSGLRGGELQAAWLVRGLCEHGVRNIVIGKPGEAFINMHPENKALVRAALPLRGELDLYSAWRLARLVRAEGVDIIHAHASHAHGIAVLAVFLGAPCRVVVSRRVNFMPKTHRLNRWKYGQADRILCVSQAVHDTLAQFGLGTPQVCTVHSAVDLERALMPPVPRSELPVPKDCPLVFSAGALTTQKDHANLLRAFARVRAGISDAHLCIAGEGPLESELHAQCAALGLAEAVHFLGYRADAPGIIRSADVYVSSSWSEGLGTSILEALASGTPVVATEAGGAREMVLPGQTGYLVPVRDADTLGDAIIHCLAHRDEAAELAAHGQEHVREHFTVERMVAGTLEAYREVTVESVRM